MVIFRNPEISGGRLKTRLMLWLIPPVVLILLATGYLMYVIADNFIDIALQRTSRLQVMAMRHAVEEFLDRSRQDLLQIAQNPVVFDELRKFIATKMAINNMAYRELAYISQTGPNHEVLVVRDGQIVRLKPEHIAEIRPNPLLYYEKVKDLKAGEVWISPITEVEHPFPTDENPNQKISSKVIYLAMLLDGKQSGPAGYLLLSFDVHLLQDILTLYNSPRSPILSYPRTPEVRFCYFFDTAGWILFQSEDPEKHTTELTTDLVRAAYTGTLGRPDLPNAFRPSSVYGPYWRMVGDVRDGQYGLIKATDSAHQSESLDDYYQAYAPVFFSPGKDAKPLVYGGIAYIDRSRLTLAAGYKEIDMMFIVTVITVLLVSLLIYFLGRAITRPILNLAEAVNRLQASGDLHPIDLPTSNYEAGVLQTAVNKMIATVKQQIEEIEIRDRRIETVSLKEKATLVNPIAAAGNHVPGGQVPGIVGAGTTIDRLKTDIYKASQVDVDVLIIGETGTGKQLAADAIHHLSPRNAKPFISINCGELDENLLLDTLFGHVKGAFTEARGDRKGAFLEADGGTLFLDEIQTASMGVQQSLLRAIAMRKIKPLGSDREIDVDVRLIAATNLDLSTLIEQNRFRSDLYFRLKVISIHTPPLREHRENLPLLAGYFLKEMERLTGKEGVALSRGALEKMKAYDWPGNIREMKNCLTRAVVMTEGGIIQAGDILLEGDPCVPAAPVDGHFEESPAAEECIPSVRDRQLPRAVRLNPRQETALPLIRQRGGVTRNDYQELIGGGLPSRTALYDLKDLVEKGLLIRVGQGPATRYAPADG
ncbi:MAG: sigma 54-interacting transcriptional regulator [Desulfobacterales bacterium]